MRSITHYSFIVSFVMKKFQKESDRYSTEDEEQKQEPEKVLKPSKEEKREEELGGVSYHSSLDDRSPISITLLV